MIVLDASALIELILSSAAGHRVAARIADPAVGLHIPHLADVEIAQVLRRYAGDGDIDDRVAASALADFRSLDLQRHAHEPLLDRVWALRRNVTAYDAVYVALAEALDAVLLTCDGRLARGARTTARVELIDRE
ncbi:MAG: type II toxin-antitoxin system VapC family toxin [Burkholderiaceae bacterium]